MNNKILTGFGIVGLVIIGIAIVKALNYGVGLWLGMGALAYYGHAWLFVGLSVAGLAFSFLLRKNLWLTIVGLLLTMALIVLTGYFAQTAFEATL